jgi:hypothetical protein
MFTARYELYTSMRYSLKLILVFKGLRPLTLGARVRFQVSPCKVVDGVARGQVFLRVSPVNMPSMLHTHLHLHIAFARKTNG